MRSMRKHLQLFVCATCTRRGYHVFFLSLLLRCIAVCRGRFFRPLFLSAFASFWWPPVAVALASRSRIPRDAGPFLLCFAAGSCLFSLCGPARRVAITCARVPAKQLYKQQLESRSPPPPLTICKQWENKNLYVHTHTHSKIDSSGYFMICNHELI